MPLFLAIVAFVVTVAIENWPSDKPSPTPAVVGTTRPFAHQPSRDPPAETKSVIAKFVESFAPKRALPSSAPPPPQTDSTAASDSSQAGPDPSEEPVPALIQLEPPTETSGQTATFTNMGHKGMTFTISTIDSTGAIHSTIQVSTPPHKQESLSQLGLLILPGDQIVVQSPPYRDYSVSAY